MEKVERIPLIKRVAAITNAMNLEEIEDKLNQFGKLCRIYAEASCELFRRSRISEKEAAKACKVYEPYIHDILEQVDAAVCVFVMEKELRAQKGRNQLPTLIVTQHTIPQGYNPTEK